MTGQPPVVSWVTVPIDSSTSPGRRTGRAAFPATRMRRLRGSPALRRMVAETRLGVDDLVAPLFVADGLDEPRPVPSMPGVVQHTVDSLAVEVKRLCGLGVPGDNAVRVAPERGQGPHRIGRSSGPVGSPSGRWPPCATRSAMSWW